MFITFSYNRLLKTHTEMKCKKSIETLCERKVHGMNINTEEVRKII